MDHPLTYPLGDVLNVTRTPDGLVAAMAWTPSGHAAQTLVSNVSYEPFGPPAGLAYGNGLNLGRSYDEDYRLTGVDLAPTSGAAPLNVSFGWQADGRIASVTDNNIPTMGPTSRTASFAYTADGRVQTGDGPWGNNSYAGACPRAGRRPDPGDATGTSPRVAA